MTTSTLNRNLYPAYRPSGVEWLAEVPAHWEVKRLKYAATLNPRVSEIRRLASDTEVSFVPMEAVGEYGGLDLSLTRELADVADGFTYFSDGDVLVAKITPCFENGKGTVAEGLLNGIAFGTTELHIVRCGPELDKRFTFYLTLGDAFRKLGAAEMYGAGGQKRVPESFVADLNQPIPALAEQRAIAAFLDRETVKIDALIAKKEQLIELLQEKRAALISRAATKGLDPNVPMKDSGVEWLGEIPAHWEVKRIKHISLVRRGASPRPIADPAYFDADGEYGWVRIADVTASNHYLERTSEYVSELGRSLSVALEPGELIVSIAGSVGKPIITNMKCCIHDGFVHFPGIPEYVEFLYYVLLSNQPYGGLGKLGTQLNLNTDTIGSIQIPSPPLPEQKSISKHLDSVTAKLDVLMATVREAIARLTELRAALISSAVTGRIDVREAMG